MRFLGVIALLLGAATVWAQEPEAPTPARDLTTRAKTKLACKDLRSLSGHDFSITTASMVPAADNMPEYCRVLGRIPPQIQFEVRLPAEWNGRFVMLGNGGYQGSIPRWWFPSVLDDNFAVAGTDTGHDSSLEPGASFAVDREKLIDFAYRAVHVTALTSKRVIRAYYKDPLDRSYFWGCSTGGRQALISAQRFPDDFDGVVVGAPILNETRTRIWNLWIAKALAAAPIGAKHLEILAERVYAVCDGIDGLEDGIIDDPRRCEFDPATDLPVCDESAGADCFSPAQIEALQKIYGDLVIDGEVFFPGQPLGAEVFVAVGSAAATMWSGWQGTLVERDGQTIMARLGSTFFKYLAFEEPNPQYDWTSFDFDSDPAKLEWLSPILDATDPDLSRLQKLGRKMLMYYGWADPWLNPLMGVDYYEAVLDRMGPSTTDFFRLFMAPGMLHCRGGVGVGRLDPLTPLIEWVENDVRPDRLIGSRIVDGKVAGTRPLCPYPMVAKYRGSGSTDEAENFVCVNPE